MATSNKNGPWDIPIRKYVEQFRMNVIIYDGDNVLKEFEIDYGDFEDRKFLGRITFWACNNGYAVETNKAEELAKTR